MNKTKTKKTAVLKIASKKSGVKKTAVKKTAVKETAVKETNNNREKIISIAKKTGKYLLYTLGVALGIVSLFIIFINLPVPPVTRNVPLGVTFSSIDATQIGLNWKDAYSAMLTDLNVKLIRIPVYWDRSEPADGQYDFSDIDWQLDQARAHNAKIILVMGEKVPRWPECYVPSWVGTDPNNFNQQLLQEKLLAFETVVINRYKTNHPEIADWQIENEPFLDFGICGPVHVSLLDAELANARSLDRTHPIVVTDSGELSLWMQAASRADIFGTTMYREVYSARVGHWRYPIGPIFFRLKLLLISLFAHQNNAIVIELQGEPWLAGSTTDAPVQTQLASMNAATLKDNVEFAKESGFDEVYVWGVEWWYWMKVVKNDPSLWNEAKALYNPTNSSS